MPLKRPPLVACTVPVIFKLPPTVPLPVNAKLPTVAEPTVAEPRVAAPDTDRVPDVVAPDTVKVEKLPGPLHVNVLPNTDVTGPFMTKEDNWRSG